MLRKNFKDPNMVGKLFCVLVFPSIISLIKKERKLMLAICLWLKKTLSQLLDSGVNKSGMMQHAEMLPSGT